MSDIVSLRSIVNRFGDHVVHDGLDLTVEEGEVLGIVGASGSGKSVLMQTMIGLHRPFSGSVEVLGADILHSDSSAMARVTCRWGVLFQNGALFSSLTVAENVETPLVEHLDMAPDLRRDLALLKLRMVGLPESAADKRPSELSGGMRKRAALARALALEPRLLFLDEPTAGLDPISASRFDSLIRHLQATLPLTTVLITHDLDTLYAVCTRVAVLVDRKIIVDSIDAIGNHEHPWIDDYFNGPRGYGARRADEIAAED